MGCNRMSEGWRETGIMGCKGLLGLLITVSSESVVRFEGVVGMWVMECRQGCCSWGQAACLMLHAVFTTCGTVLFGTHISVGLAVIPQNIPIGHVASIHCCCC
jgi:hypothetical protein